MQGVAEVFSIIIRFHHRVENAVFGDDVLGDVVCEQFRLPRVEGISVQAVLILEFQPPEFSVRRRGQIMIPNRVVSPAVRISSVHNVRIVDRQLLPIMSGKIGCIEFDPVFSRRVPENTVVFEGVDGREVPGAHGVFRAVRTCQRKFHDRAAFDVCAIQAVTVGNISVLLPVIRDGVVYKRAVSAEEEDAVRIGGEHPQTAVRHVVNAQAAFTEITPVSISTLADPLTKQYRLSIASPSRSPMPCASANGHSSPCEQRGSTQTAVVFALDRMVLTGIPPLLVRNTQRSDKVSCVLSPVLHPTIANRTARAKSKSIIFRFVFMSAYPLRFDPFIHHSQLF